MGEVPTILKLGESCISMRPCIHLMVAFGMASGMQDILPGLLPQVQVLVRCLVLSKVGGNSTVMWPLRSAFPVDKVYK